MTSAEPAADTPRLEVRDFAGTLTLTTGGERVELVSRAGGAAWPVQAVQSGAGFVLAGTVTAAPSACVTQNGFTTFQFGGGAPVPLDVLPQVELRVPAGLAVDISGFSGALRVEQAGNFRLTATGCSRSEIGTLSGAGEVSLAPGARLELAHAGDFTLHAASARVTLGEVTGRLALTMPRAGETRVARHEGELVAELGSAARLSIASGRSAPARIEVGRAGRLVHGGELEGLDLVLGAAARAELAEPGREPVIRQGPASQLSIRHQAGTE